MLIWVPKTLITGEKLSGGEYKDEIGRCEGFGGTARVNKVWAITEGIKRGGTEDAGKGY